MNPKLAKNGNFPEEDNCHKIAISPSYYTRKVAKKLSQISTVRVTFYSKTATLHNLFLTIG